MRDKTFRYHVAITGTVKATSEAHARIRLENSITMTLGLTREDFVANIQLQHTPVIDDLLNLEDKSA